MGFLLDLFLEPILATFIDWGRKCRDKHQKHKGEKEE